MHGRRRCSCCFGAAAPFFPAGGSTTPLPSSCWRCALAWRWCFSGCWAGASGAGCLSRARAPKWPAPGLLLVGGYSCAYFLALDQGLTPGALATILGVRPKVAIQQPLEACAHGVAVHGAHHRLGAAHQRARDALHVFAHLRHAGRRGGLIVEGFQIIASAKRAAGAGQHDGARGGVGLSSLQLRVQIAQQIGVDGVQPLGPLQRDDADGAIGLQADGAGGRWRGAHAVDYRHSPYDQAIIIRRRP